jgi:hypothetical protein
MYFSYRQFFIYDPYCEFFALRWSDAHSRQGFARTRSFVSMSSISNYGWATVLAGVRGFHEYERFDRVIAVPFTVSRGVVAVLGVEETGELERFLHLDTGEYKLTVAQAIYDDDSEEVVLAFEPVRERVMKSHIIVADAELDPPDPLVETAEPFR